MAANDDMPISALFEPSLVRTNSYSKAMNGGLDKLHFGAAIFSSPDLTGVTKHFNATLTKTDQQKTFGFAIGTCDDGTHVVHSVMKGCLAEAVLEVDDEINIINNDVAAKIPHDQLIESLAQLQTVKLQISRSRNNYMDVVLTKVDGSFGLSVGSQNQSYLFVSEVSPGGAADGKIETGDLIVAVNGTLVGSLTHDDSIALIGGSDKVRLTIGRSDEIKAFFEKRQSNVVQIKRVTLSRESANIPFGIGIGDAVKFGQVISDVTPDVEELGVKPGDILVEVNGEVIVGKEHSQVIALMQHQTELNLKLQRPYKQSAAATTAAPTIQPETEPTQSEPEIPKTPVAQPNEIITLERDDVASSFGFSFGTLDDEVKLVTSVQTDGIAAGKLQANDELVSINGVSVIEVQHDALVELVSKELKLEIAIHRGDGTRTFFEQSVIERRKSIGLITEVADVETITAVLTRDSTDESFGFGMGTSDDGRAFITSVQAGGIAEKAGVKDDDEIFSINGTEIVGTEHDVIVAMIIDITNTTLVLKRERGDETEAPKEPTEEEKEAEAAEEKEAEVQNVLSKFIERRSSTKDLKKETKIVTVTRENKETGFGFGIGTLEDGGQVITKVNAAREEEGFVAVADEIVSINGIAATTLSHDKLVELICEETELELCVIRVIGSKLARGASISAIGTSVTDRHDNIGGATSSE